MDGPRWNRITILTVGTHFLVAVLWPIQMVFAWCEPSAQLQALHFTWPAYTFCCCSIKGLTYSSYHVQFRNCHTYHCYVSYVEYLMISDLVIKYISEALAYPKTKSRPWNCWSPKWNQQVLWKAWMNFWALGTSLSSSITLRPIQRGLHGKSQQHMQALHFTRPKYSCGSMKELACFSYYEQFDKLPYISVLHCM